MKLATIAFIALTGIAFAQSPAATTNLDKVIERTSKLKESIDKATISLEKASKTSEEAYARYDTAIDMAERVLGEVGENGPVQKLIEKALKENESTLKTIEEKQRTSKKAESMLEPKKQQLLAAITDAYEAKTTMIKMQFDAMKKLKEFKESKEIIVLMDAADILIEANKDLANVIKGISELGSSLDDFKIDKDKAVDDAKPSKN